MTTTIGGSYPAVNSDSDATINGLTVGKGGGSNAFATAIGNGALAASNSGSVLAVGYQTLASNTTGDDITAVGSYRALYTNTTGSYLVAVGRQALQANTTASFNTAIGHKSSFSNTTGANNSSLGYHSLYSNTTGSANVGLGQEALYSNTTASNNTAVGYQAAYTNTTGAGLNTFGYQAGYTSNQTIDAFGYQTLKLATGGGNSAFGTLALQANTTGTNNVAVGRDSLYSNTTSSNSTAVGYQAGYSNNGGSRITALGMQALYSNTTADNNVAIGYQAGYSLTTGGGNIAIGYITLDAATTGGANTAVGNRAAGLLTTGQYNTIIGADAGAALTTGNSNCFVGATGTAYGSGEAVTTGNKNTILGSYSGNNGGLDIRTASNYIVLSDGDGNPRAWCSNAPTWFFAGPEPTANFNCTNATTAYKTIIDFNASGSSAGYIQVRQTGTTYNSASDYRMKENVEPMTGALATVARLKPVTYTWKADGSDGQGFIAHELGEVIPEACAGEKDAVNEDGSPKYQAIDTSLLVATLTAAIQELNAKLEAQALEIATLKGK
jgi:hypothetical protein